MAAQSAEGSRPLRLLGEPHGAEGWIRPLEGPSTPGIRLTWNRLSIQGGYKWCDPISRALDTAPGQPSHCSTDMWYMFWSRASLLGSPHWAPHLAGPNGIWMMVCAQIRLLAWTG